MLEDISILYEDENIVAINKPAGLIVHADGRGKNEETVADWFVTHYPNSASVGEDPIETNSGQVITRPGVVHRLDRDTSGVMLLAKTDQGHAHLKQQFQNRTTEKTYTALVYGAMKQDEYVVTADIGRSRNFGRWTAIPKSVRGVARDAETYIRVINRRGDNPNEGYSLVEARPKTGRTHQIRVHLQYLNHPIVADALYAGKRNTDTNNLGFTRQALHASSIKFETVEGGVVEVQSPIPVDFNL